jgi:hypothetical protein
VSGSDLSFEFPTMVGRRYCVETCTDLTKADWRVISDSIPGTGQPITVIDDGAAANGKPQGFYRVRIKMP